MSACLYKANNDAQRPEKTNNDVKYNESNFGDHFNEHIKTYCDLVSSLFLAM